MTTKIRTLWFRLVLALGALGLVIGSLAGCSSGKNLCENAQGKITEKDSDYSRSTKTWDYDFTVLVTKDPKTGADLGDKAYTYEIDVSSGTYDDYKNGSRFPGKKCDPKPSGQES